MERDPKFVNPQADSLAHIRLSGNQSPKAWHSNQLLSGAKAHLQDSSWYLMSHNFVAHNYVSANDLDSGYQMASKQEGSSLGTRLHTH